MELSRTQGICKETAHVVCTANPICQPSLEFSLMWTSLIVTGCWTDTVAWLWMSANSPHLMTVMLRIYL